MCFVMQAMAHPEESCLPKTADDEYDSAFPNVGLVVWQAGFVLGEWLLRAQPAGPWGKPLRVLELGCGIGAALALAGAALLSLHMPMLAACAFTAPAVHGVSQLGTAVALALQRH
jgi:SAM-dependent methyltransferase